MDAPEQDHLLAASLAREAGDLLLDLRDELQRADVDPKTMKDAGDSAAHNLLMTRLTEARPGDAVLSEEGKDELERLQADRVWIVDPLDGTREFSEPPRVDWAVHVALVRNNEPIAGAVALPAENLILSTSGDPDRNKALVELRGEPPEVPRVIVSRTRRPEAVQRLAEALGATYIEMGSAGAKTMAVVRGQADIYAHTGGQYEWDSCAPVAVAKAVGLHCSRIDGSPLSYNAADPYLPDLLVCRQELAGRCLEELASILS